MNELMSESMYARQIQMMADQIAELKKENAELKNFIDKIEWETSQCYGMENPDAFQFRRIHVLINEHKDRKK